MPDPIMTIARELLLVRDIIAADQGELYEIPAGAAVADLEIAIVALRVGVSLRAAPAWRPALPILIGKLRAARALLERTVLLSESAVEAAIAGSALRPLGAAIALLAIAAVITDHRAIDRRATALHAIADQLQAALDQIDALGDRTLEVSVAACSVQETVARLRTQAGAAPIDARAAGGPVTADLVAIDLTGAAA